MIVGMRRKQALGVVVEIVADRAVAVGVFLLVLRLRGALFPGGRLLRGRLLLVGLRVGGRLLLVVGLGLLLGCRLLSMRCLLL